MFNFYGVLSKVRHNIPTKSRFSKITSNELLVRFQTHCLKTTAYVNKHVCTVFTHGRNSLPPPTKSVQDMPILE